MKPGQTLSLIHNYATTKFSMAKYLFNKLLKSNHGLKHGAKIKGLQPGFPYLENNLLKNRHEELVTVIMTTFNTEKFVRKAIDSILHQSYKNLELIIVDDASSDNTVNVIKEINDPRIMLFRNKFNCGTYYSKNFALTKASGKYVTLQDSDDYSDPSRIEKQVAFLKANKKCQYVKCQYVRVDKDGHHLMKPRIAFQSTLFRKELFNKLGYYDSVRVAADDEFDSRAKLVIGTSGIGILEELLYYNLEREDSLTNQVKIGGDIRLEYVNQYRNWHASSKNSGRNTFIPFPLIKRPFAAPAEITIDFNKPELVPCINVSRVHRHAEKVTATLATIPERIEMLAMTVNSILPQVDELRIYLNNFDEVPAFLKQAKIICQLSGETGDLADNGKFFWKDIEGFHFTIDDDIVYPANYVKFMVNKLRRYNYSVITGVHGIIINQKSFKSYYELNSRTVYPFKLDLHEDKFVNIIGTGTMAYHTNTFKFDLSRAHSTRMIDIFVGMQAQEQKIPMVATARPKNWLMELSLNQKSIYNHYVNDDSVQTGLVSSSRWVEYS